MSTTVAQPTSALRRRFLGVALATAIAASGFGAHALATNSDHAGQSVSGLRKVEMCWYQGWFKEGGVWYQGWFKEAC